MSIDVALQAATLKRLPAKLRESALDVFGTLSDEWMSVADQLDVLGESRLVLLAPIFYAAMDRSKLSILQNLDSSNPEDVRAVVGQVFCSITAFAAILAASPTLPPRAVVQLWPRLWESIAFIDVAHPQLPLHSEASLGPAPTPEEELDPVEYFYAQAMCILSQLWKVRKRIPELDALMSRTPGVYELVGRAWPILATSGNTNALQYISGVVLLYMNDNITSSDTTFRDCLIQGAGGAAALAHAILRQMTLACPADRQKRPLRVLLSAPATLCLHSVSSHSPHVHRGLRKAFIEAGFMPVLLRAIASLARRPEPGADFAAITMFLTTLDSLFNEFPFHIHMRQALNAEHDLISVLLLCTWESKVDGPLVQRQVGEYVGAYLRLYLPSATVYASAVPSLHAAIVEVQAQRPRPEDKLRSPELVVRWEYLVGLVEARMQHLKDYRSGNLQAGRFRACDNIECCRIAFKTELKWCSGCRESYYCSRDCQRTDWRESHRRICAANRRAREECALSPRDLSYLHALLETAWIQTREDIPRNHIRSFYHGWYEPPSELLKIPGISRADAANPDTLLRLRLARFDFAEGRGEAQPTLRIDDAFFAQAIPAEHVRRVLRSKGRLELHTLGINNGREVAWRVVPLKTPSGGRLREIKAILAGLPRGMSDDAMNKDPELRRRIKAMNSGLVVECH
ncbi:MYND-type domain-containing protein [Mycena kentingensis (nom. inval.)]|nr:MYND-type domain-containing protein [Mycena kentingensis (nom. inval.)]